MARNTLQECRIPCRKAYPSRGCIVPAGECKYNQLDTGQKDFTQEKAQSGSVFRKAYTGSGRRI